MTDTTPVCVHAGHYRLQCYECVKESHDILQAENERLSQQVAALHGAMRAEWSDLVAENERLNKKVADWGRVIEGQNKRIASLNAVITELKWGNRE